ncbi:acyltransferase [Butyrivibrio sp. WCD3002]|uniref:acyltransferase n=1 Tax=Butyrivibrio sp. WCD3002 TaxID=1280676 RepID=UPI000411E704|nr:acyltransferase [Butyrivibrio sp. WCD3002]
MFVLKSILKRIIYRERVDSETFVKYLRKKGASIGIGAYFFSPELTNVDAVRIDHIKIGDYTKITSGCTILAHDYSSSVLLHTHKEILLPGGNEVNIGKNCFIGMNSTILMGSSIGDNVIVGANSLVCGDIPSNCIVGGVPAKILMSLDDYYQKRKDLFLQDAVRNVNHFIRIHNRPPKIEEIGAFATLFIPRNDYNFSKYIENYLSAGNDPIDVRKAFFESEPIFNGYDCFLEYCLNTNSDD